MDKVNPHAIKGSAKVREAVQRGFLGPPVKLRAPVVDQLLDIGQIRAIVPRRARDLTGPAGAGEALTQIRQHLVRHMDSERLHGRHDVLLCPWRFRSLPGP